MREKHFFSFPKESPIIRELEFLIYFAFSLPEILPESKRGSADLIDAWIRMINEQCKNIV